MLHAHTRLTAPGLLADRCDSKVCLEDPSVVGLTNRISDLALVPPNNSEFIQLLRQLPHPRAATAEAEARSTVLPLPRRRYKECPYPTHADCQFYKRHHDTIPELAKMPCGCAPMPPLERARRPAPLRHRWPKRAHSHGSHA